MKRIALAFALACSVLGLSAQNVIKVNYQGAKPTINDFAWACISTSQDEDEDVFDELTAAVQDAWTRHSQGKPLPEGVTLTIDSKNGFVLYESRYESHLVRVEMCYWNEGDQKHKLFAYNVQSFSDGIHAEGQFDGLIFYRYDNATKKMTLTHDTGFEVEYRTDDGASVSYALPRSGKDITVTYWYDNGTQKHKTLKWNNRRFSW